MPQFLKTGSRDDDVTRKKSTKQTSDQPTSRYTGSQATTAQTMLQLQRVIGNAAVQELQAAHVQRGGEDGDTPATEPVEGSLRPSLGRKLWENLYGSNWFARGIFKTMNLAMYIEGKPLSKEHNEVLENELLNKESGLIDTLIAENPHVLRTRGYTPVYLMGKYLVHKPLEYYIRRRNEKNAGTKIEIEDKPD